MRNVADPASAGDPVIGRLTEFIYDECCGFGSPAPAYLLNRNTCWLVLKKIDKITGAETQEHCRPLRCPSLRAKTDLGIRAL
jgi:hypothetical protein